MYNLTVDIAHTFFVGDGQWLVHNTCSPDYQLLKRKLASQEQMGQEGHVIAGPGSDSVYRDAARHANILGETADDLAKMSSTNHVEPGGAQLETHWVQNMKTGARYMFKTIIKKLYGD